MLYDALTLKIINVYEPLSVWHKLQNPPVYRKLNSGIPGTLFGARFRVQVKIYTFEVLAKEILTG
jgi:hypothetical protein